MDHPSGTPASELQSRLDDPRIAAALVRLLDRIESIERLIESLAGAANSFPDLVATAADAADDQCRQLDQQGVNLTSRGRDLAGLLEQVTRPETVAALRSLVERLPGLAEASALVAQAPDLAAIAGDALDELAARKVAGGVSLADTFTRGLQALLWLGNRIGPRELELLERLLNSAAATPATIELVARVADAATRAEQAQDAGRPDRVGALGLLGALREPAIQRAVAWAVRFGRNFGNRHPES